MIALSNGSARDLGFGLIMRQPVNTLLKFTLTYNGNDEDTKVAGITIVLNVICKKMNYYYVYSLIAAHA